MVGAGVNFFFFFHLARDGKRKCKGSRGGGKRGETYWKDRHYIRTLRPVSYDDRNTLHES